MRIEISWRQNLDTSLEALYRWEREDPGVQLHLMVHEGEAVDLRRPS